MGFSQKCRAALAACCGLTWSFFSHGVEAQARPVERQAEVAASARRPTFTHPAFAAKQRDPIGYRVASVDEPEGCSLSKGDLQHVRDYDGTLGVSYAFVESHKDPVGKLIVGQEACSGTLIARNLFLTASHCVDNTTKGRGLVEFNDEKLAGSSNSAPPTRYVIADVVEDGISGGLDFAIVRLEDRRGIHANPGDAFGVTAIDPFVPAEQHMITIVQHPNGEQKQVGVGHLLDRNEDHVRYTDVQTSAGSSGAGILDDQGRLVGVHIGGNCTEGKVGVRMSRIVSASTIMQALLPPDLLERTARIHSLLLQDVGLPYGSSPDELGVEAVVLLEGDAQPYGFTMRTGTDTLAHQSMFELLLDAFASNALVRVEFLRETHRSNRVLRVVRK